MKVLSTTDDSTGPWGTPPVTGFHLDTELLTNSLDTAMQPFFFFFFISQTAQLLNQYPLIQLQQRWGELNHRPYRSPSRWYQQLLLHLLKQSMHSGWPQIAQAWFAHGAATLAIPNHLLVLHMSWHNFQEDPFHYVFTTLFKSRSDVSLSPVIRDFTCCHDFSKMMWYGLGLLQLSWILLRNLHTSQLFLHVHIHTFYMFLKKS